MHVSPRLKADVTTAVLFCAALLLEPGVAALAGVVGIVCYNFLNGHWGERLRLPWYKYPFNAGETALFVGVTSVVFGALTSGEGVLTAAVVPAAAVMYVANTLLVSVAVGLQLGVNPLRVWWSGTVENGPAELGQLAFGFLGAVAYRESPWTIVALFIPVAVIYVAFSRLARANTQVVQTTEELTEANGALKAEIEERQHKELALRQSEERHRLLFNSAADPMFYVDSSTGKLLLANGPLIEQSGYSEGELVGSQVTKLIPKLHWPAGLGLTPGSALDSGATVQFEAEYHLRSGAVRPIEVSAVALEDPDGRRVIQCVLPGTSRSVSGSRRSGSVCSRRLVLTTRCSGLSPGGWWRCRRRSDATWPGSSMMRSGRC